MTSFATCAYTGCTQRISYDPKEDDSRSRYCMEHAQVIRDRLGNHFSWSDLNIQVGNKISINPVDEITKTIILMCPLCKFRKEVPAIKIGLKVPCGTYGCTGIMIYHKDAGENYVR